MTRTEGPSFKEREKIGLNIQHQSMNNLCYHVLTVCPLLIIEEQTFFLLLFIIFLFSFCMWAYVLVREYVCQRTYLEVRGIGSLLLPDGSKDCTQVKCTGRLLVGPQCKFSVFLFPIQWGVAHCYGLPPLFPLLALADVHVFAVFGAWSSLYSSCARERVGSWGRSRCRIGGHQKPR